jgi:hypothetical protein
MSRKLPLSTPLSIRIKWALVGFIEAQIETLITRRILKYHRRLVADGLIADGSVVDGVFRPSPPLSPRASPDLALEGSTQPLCGEDPDPFSRFPQREASHPSG